MRPVGVDMMSPIHSKKSKYIYRPARELDRSTATGSGSVSEDVSVDGVDVIVFGVVSISCICCQGTDVGRISVSASCCTRQE